ncbi:CpsD/CapB family tyrosine-protein kinase [Jeotgalibacillus salarius]|uniref:non-specific protein-tyrosine kinase n=1 Tax=Jeotgalibacillus salarius TaxID=546023 RepID=A0A4Y8LHQ4_9BACL|nr:CpsD/CapB family tyrosine-protein kinase [Jeotgalibacillus salarius]TFE01697.1 polysaccharide biosynthesis tyrosine autokinase [Jeotgalibacillus salarius]
MKIKRKSKPFDYTIRHLITEVSPMSQEAEQFRTIRTNIMFSSAEQNSRILMVTSGGPSEGKSTVAANLAISFAQQGKKTLLVDADLRKPTVHISFRLINTLGLTNFLTRQIELEGAVQSTSIKMLDVLTSGPIPPNPAELLGSSVMQRFLEEALKGYDLVLFDTPPVTVVADAKILSNVCDGTILVCKHGKTERQSLVKSKELLSAAQSKILGVVINGKKNKKKEMNYYYGTS